MTKIKNLSLPCHYATAKKTDRATFLLPQKRKISFAFGEKVYKTNLPNQRIYLSDLAQIIRSKPPSELLKIKEITTNGLSKGRSLQDIKKLIAPLKKGLPFVIFSGYCPKSHNNKTLEYNGSIQIDIDLKYKGGDKEAANLKEQIKKIPYVSIAAISPSNFGLKCLIQTTNTDIDNHKDVSSILIKVLANELNLKTEYFDNVAASAPCFVPFDKELYVNDSASKYDPFKELYELEKRKKEDQKRKVEELQNRQVEVSLFDNNENKSVPDIITLEYLTAEIVRSGLNITNNWGDWFKIACAYASEGEQARGLFHQVAQLCDTYNYEENEDKFNQGLKNKTGLGVLVNVCKENGIYINDFCKDWLRENGNKNQKKLSSQKIETRYELGDKQHIGDLLKSTQIKKGINYLIGGTGTGKTHFVANNFNKVIIVSRNVSTLDNYNKYGFTRYSTKSHFTLDEVPDKITVTYKSLKNVFAEIDLSGYLIVFDEYHQLVDSYSEVRKETRFAYELLETIQLSNRVVLASANDVWINNPKLKTKTKTIFTKPSVKRNVLLGYNACPRHLVKQIRKRLSEGKKVLLLTNRKEDKDISTYLKKEFTNKKITFFDSTQHGKVDLSNLSADITICTKALTTGKDINTKNIAAIVYCLDYGMKRATINQFLGRAREYESATFDVLFKFKSKEDITEISKDSLLISRRTIAKQVIESSISDVSLCQENKDRFVKKDKNGKLVINYFEIDNSIESTISKQTIFSPEVMTSFFSSHGYEVTKKIFEEAEDKEEEIKTEDASEKIKEIYIKEVELIDNSEALNHEALKTNAYNRVFGLVNIGLKKIDAVQLAKEHTTPVKWKRLVYSIISELRLSTNDFAYKRDHKKVLQAIKGKAHNIKELIGIIKTLRSSSTCIGRLINRVKTSKKEDKNISRKLLKDLREYYNVVVVHGNKENLYVFSLSKNIPEEILKKANLDDIKKLFRYSKYERKTFNFFDSNKKMQIVD